jgi:predicted acyltransferase (DUF342 family)
MVFDRSLCHIPAGTVLDENNVRSKGDVIVSDRSQIERNLITEGRIFLGESVVMEGDIVSIGEIRIDKGGRILGNITGDQDIFIGERCKIAGELVVGKNLEIGEGVEIDPQAIDSKGRVNIKNPISVIVYILIYLLELLRRNDSKEVENFFKELEEGDEENFLVSKEFTYLPRGSRITKQGFDIPGDMKIAHGCQVIGDLDVGGSLDIGEEVQVFGDIHTKGDLYLGENTVINGNIRSEGRIDIHHAARLAGNLNGTWISTTSDTLIDGTLKGEDGIRILTESGTAVEEKMERFSQGVDDLHGIVD